MTDDQLIIDADSQPVQQKAKRKKGAQPGNINALRHGFYARDLGKISPSQYSEVEMRNLLGEAAMLKDYMYFIYNCNLGSADSAVLAETLRALSLAGMSLSRLLQVHNHIRIVSSDDSSLSDLLDSMNVATARANRFLE